MVTQLDLVAEQIRVASGEPLSFTQEEIVRRGHAIEVRINAENSAKGFLPSPGRITELHVPSGPGVRWDGGYETGDDVSQYYDNLVGKLVVWHSDRDRARHRMLRALGELRVEGVHTTVPAHELVLRHPDFASGNHSTRWLEEEVDLSGLTSDPGRVESAADADAPAARTLPVEVDGRRFEVKVFLPEGAIAAPSGPAPRKAARPKPRVASASPTGGGGGDVVATMQGTIVKLLVEIGQAVTAGESVLVLEAMKMENHIVAEIDGAVKEIRAAAGDTVGAGDVLVVID
jgi:acetyl-CoA/propionyl-CoA carboxylase biotin carboxyl carrier protein